MNYLDPNVCLLIKKALVLTQITRKSLTITFLLNKHPIKILKVVLVQKIVTLVISTKVTLSTKVALTTVAMAIKVILTIKEVIITLAQLETKRTPTQRSYKFGCLKVQYHQIWSFGTLVRTLLPKDVGRFDFCSCLYVSKPNKISDTWIVDAEDI